MIFFRRSGARISAKHFHSGARMYVRAALIFALACVHPPCALAAACYYCKLATEERRLEITPATTRFYRRNANASRTFERPLTVRNEWSGLRKRLTMSPRRFQRINLGLWIGLDFLSYRHAFEIASGRLPRLRVLSAARHIAA